MSARLIESLATTEPLADLFCDESVLSAMLEFEVALSRAEGRVGVIPKAAADAIAAAAKVDKFDIAALSRATLRAGTPAIPLVKTLTGAVLKKDPDAARFVHWGATSQDVADSAISLLLKQAEPILIGDLELLENSLTRLAKEHQASVMLGRTLLQAAPPVTLGLKSAGWLGSIRRVGYTLREAFTHATVLQFGGASGTLAFLGDKGIAVGKALAKELGLALPEAPWHTHRDRWATLVCVCGVLTGSLGKMARDISLLMQNEIDEAAEPGGEGRGGSSTMPQKRNPIACSLALAAAYRVPGLVSSYLSAMVQEHERAVGGWQAEWPILSGVVQSTGLALASMAEVTGRLAVNPKAMRANIERTNGAIFAERAMMLLGSNLGRDAAHKMLQAASERSAAENRHLADVLGEIPEITAYLGRETLQQLEIPENYLGSADKFRKALLSKSSKPKKP